MRCIESKQKNLQRLLSLLEYDVGPVYWYDSVGSTMDVGFELSDAADRTIIVADSQTMGRGRHGRPWHSNSGSLICSIVLTRFDIRFPYSMLAAYGVYRAFRRYTGEVRLKWINDVLWANGKKISGVIAEERQGRTVIGIGVNLNNLDINQELEGTATSYLRETGKSIRIARFLKNLLDEFFRVLSAVDNDGIERVMTGWEEDARIRGRIVRVVDSTREFVGTAIGIDKQTGALLLRTKNEEVRVYEGSLIYI
jgi:BirA family biotin operon repressor/biotin-[acetyl-CoA-carboxylase] ligase